MFLSVIGVDLLESFDGMDLSPETDHEIPNNIVKKLKEICIGNTNETDEKFIFNRHNQEENKSVNR